MAELKVHYQDMYELKTAGFDSPVCRYIIRAKLTRDEKKVTCIACQRWIDKYKNVAMSWSGVPIDQRYEE